MNDGLLTVLVENTAGKMGLIAEHGLSFWIGLDGRKILFDTGQGNVLAHNARRLGIALDEADFVVLSHGHYDHTGGLGDAPVRPLHAHPAAFEPKFGRNPDGSSRPIGMPDIKYAGERVPVTGPTRLTERLWLTGPVPRRTDFEDTGGPFFLDAACTCPDPLTDDQAAFAETPLGTVVILGCAHVGIINTLWWIRELTGDRPIHTVVGGTHLVNASAERLDRTVAELRRLDIQRLLSCHCTGFPAQVRLWNEFPGRCATCPTGTALDIGG